MKNIVKYFYFALVLVSLTLMSCSDNASDTNELANTPEVYTPVALSPQQVAMANKSTDFSHHFFATYDADKQNENYIVSPLSLQYALAMIANGAEGNTLTQILNALDYQASEIEALNEFCHTLMTEIPKVSNRSKMSIYNNMWYNSQFVESIYPTFQNSLATYYGASCFASNNNTIVADVNNWVKDKSDGRIKKIVNDVDPSFHSIIVNVLNFEGFWQNKLSTDLREFHNANGTIVKEDFLTVSENIITRFADKGNIYDIPYSNKAYYLRIIFPNDGISLSDFIADFPEQYKNAELCPHKSCKVRFPKFECESQSELNGMLIKMDIVDLFDKDSSKLTGMSATPLIWIEYCKPAVSKWMKMALLSLWQLRINFFVQTFRLISAKSSTARSHLKFTKQVPAQYFFRVESTNCRIAD